MFSPEEYTGLHWDLIFELKLNTNAWWAMVEPDLIAIWRELWETGFLSAD